MTQPDRRPAAEDDRARCRACNASVTGAFCQACGQRHRDELPTLREFAKEAIVGVLDLDGPLWASVRTLVRRPGALTVAYWDGRHSTFVSPIKLFIVASAVYFVVSRSLNANAALFIRFTGATSTEGMLRLMEPLMILLVPALGAIVMLVRRDGRRYLAHLVFAMHVHIAWFALLAVSVVLDEAVSGGWQQGRVSAFDVAQVLAILYLGFAVRGAYRPRISAVVGQSTLIMLLYLALMVPTALFVTGFGAG